MFCRSFFVLFLLGIVLSVFPRLRLLIIYVIIRISHVIFKQIMLNLSYVYPSPFIVSIPWWWWRRGIWQYCEWRGQISTVPVYRGHCNNETGIYFFHCDLSRWKGSSCSWSYGSWIYNFLCNQCPSPLKLGVRILSWRGGLWYNIM